MSGITEFREGWKIVVAAIVGIGTGLTTLIFYTTGVFLPQLTSAFGWTDAQVMLSVTIVLILASALGPVVGLLADRVGARRVILFSVAALGFGWMLMALGHGSLPVFYLQIALVTILGAGTLPITWTRGVIRSFRERRGMALGLCLVGTGLFGTGAKWLSFRLIEAFGWRGGYVGLGLVLLLVTWPIAYLFFHEKPSGIESDVPDPDHEQGLTLRQAVATRQFWIMVATFLLLSLSISGIAPNLERFVTAMGFGMTEAVALASFYGIGIIAGRLLTGVCLDRFWAPAVITLMLVPTVGAYALLATGPVSATTAAVAILMFGSAAGVEYDALAYLISRYFGPRAYGSIYGCVYIGFAIGAGFGPYLFSRIAAAGGYAPLMAGTAIVAAAGAVLPLLLGPYPKSLSFPSREPS